MKKIIMLMLMLVISLSLVFAKVLPEESGLDNTYISPNQIEENKLQEENLKKEELEYEKKARNYRIWAKKQTKYLEANTLMVVDSDKVFYKLYNQISNRGGVISDEFMAYIEDKGGIINDRNNLCEILEVSKINKNIVRVKILVMGEFLSDNYWVNLGNIKKRYK